MDRHNLEVPSTVMVETGIKKHKSLRFLLLLLFFFVLCCFVLFPVFHSQLITANQSSDIKASGVISIESSADPVSPSPVPDINQAGAVLTDEPSEENSKGNDSTFRVSSYSVLKYNDSYPAVKNLQLRLMELGYLETDEPESKYNEATSAAVSMFQRTISEETNGIADADLQTILFSEEALPYEVALGAQGTDVRSAQKLLTELGYYTGKINGYFGTATEEALMKFQTKNNLSKDGIYNLDDREVLFSENARPLIDPTPSPEPTKKPSTTKKPAKTEKPAKSENDSKSESSSNEKEYKTGGSFNASGDVSGLISVAEAQIGKRYVTGDEGPNTFDCSGLIHYCLNQNGVRVGRRSSSSYSENNAWTLISSMKDISRGDLLFFRSDSSSNVSHVGLYIGGGKMIDASSSRGEVVLRSCTGDYWTRNFVCARRVF